jgi:S-(hydroxymethyl)glutathione dehydrogenase/alcohol dehydrogenase
MVTHTYRLSDLGQALDDMLTGRSAKGVILFDERDDLLEAEA